jgi:hypothetical protein
MPNTIRAVSAPTTTNSLVQFINRSLPSAQMSAMGRERTTVERSRWVESGRSLEHRKARLRSVDVPAFVGAKFRKHRQR